MFLIVNLDGCNFNAMKVKKINRNLFYFILHKVSCKLAKFVDKSVCDITDTILPSLLALAMRIIAISVMSPKVAMASTVLTIACRCWWHFRPNVRAKLRQWKPDLIL